MILNEIEILTRKLADAREELTAIIARLQNKQDALLQDSLPAIKKCVSAAAARHTLLFTGVDESRALFVKPRTQVFSGIKVGLRKGSGGVDWDDDAIVCDRIEKRFPRSQAELLIKTTKKPITKALQDLDVADLKAIGCRVEDTGDVIVIKPIDGAVDKIVTSLLKGAIDEAKQEAA
jgi:hypothetical protein